MITIKTISLIATDSKVNTYKNGTVTYSSSMNILCE